MFPVFNLQQKKQQWKREHTNAFTFMLVEEEWAEHILNRG